jgi:hypothetical protein
MLSGAIIVLAGAILFGAGAVPRPRWRQATGTPRPGASPWPPACSWASSGWCSWWPGRTGNRRAPGSGAAGLLTWRHLRPRGILRPGASHGPLPTVDNANTPGPGFGCPVSASTSSGRRQTVRGGTRRRARLISWGARWRIRPFRGPTRSPSSLLPPKSRSRSPAGFSRRFGGPFGLLTGSFSSPPGEE